MGAGHRTKLSADIASLLQLTASIVSLCVLNEDDSIAVTICSPDASSDAGKVVLLTTTEDYPKGDTFYWCEATQEGGPITGTLVEIVTKLQKKFFPASTTAAAASSSSSFAPSSAAAKAAPAATLASSSAPSSKMNVKSPSRHDDDDDDRQHHPHPDDDTTAAAALAPSFLRDTALAEKAGYYMHVEKLVFSARVSFTVPVGRIVSDPATAKSWGVDLSRPHFRVTLKFESLKGFQSGNVPSISLATTATPISSSSSTSSASSSSSAAAAAVAESEEGTPKPLSRFGHQLHGLLCSYLKDNWSIDKGFVPPHIKEYELEKQQEIELDQLHQFVQNLPHEKRTDWMETLTIHMGYSEDAAAGACYWSRSLDEAAQRCMGLIKQKDHEPLSAKAIQVLQKHKNNNNNNNGNSNKTTAARVVDARRNIVYDAAAQQREGLFVHLIKYLLHRTKTAHLFCIWCGDELLVPERDTAYGAAAAAAAASSAPGSGGQALHGTTLSVCTLDTCRLAATKVRGMGRQKPEVASAAAAVHSSASSAATTTAAASATSMTQFRQVTLPERLIPYVTLFENFENFVEFDEGAQPDNNNNQPRRGILLLHRTYTPNESVSSFVFSLKYCSMAQHPHVEEHFCDFVGRSMYQTKVHHVMTKMPPMHVSHSGNVSMAPQSLRTLVTQQLLEQKQPFTRAKIFSIFAQALLAVEFLHSRSATHGNVSAACIFVTLVASMDDEFIGNLPAAAVGSGDSARTRFSGARFVDHVHLLDCRATPTALHQEIARRFNNERAAADGNNRKIACTAPWSTNNDARFDFMRLGALLFELCTLQQMPLPAFAKAATAAHGKGRKQAMRLAGEVVVEEVMALMAGTVGGGAAAATKSTIVMDDELQTVMSMLLAAPSSDALRVRDVVDASPSLQQYYLERYLGDDAASIIAASHPNTVSVSSSSSSSSSSSLSRDVVAAAEARLSRLSACCHTLREQFARIGLQSLDQKAARVFNLICDIVPEYARQAAVDSSIWSGSQQQQQQATRTMTSSKPTVNTTSATSSTTTTATSSSSAAAAAAATNSSSKPPAPRAETPKQEQQTIVLVVGESGDDSTVEEEVIVPLPEGDTECMVCMINLAACGRSVTVNTTTTTATGRNDKEEQQHVHCNDCAVSPFACMHAICFGCCVRQVLEAKKMRSCPYCSAELKKEIVKIVM